IGRSFIGQLFGQSDYHVVFIDVDLEIVKELNRRCSYPVVIKGEKDETILMENVRAVSGLDREVVKREIAQTAIMAVCVGKNALVKIMPVIAEGLMLRQELTPNCPLDIIIAENMRSANKFIHENLTSLLPENYPLDKIVGLVETSIGKMVPIMTEDDLKDDPLMIFAESYNTLIVDKRGFKRAIPEVKGLSAKENIQAWVDRKAFIHNLGHAATAYIGSYHHPKTTFIYEVLNDKNVLNAVYSVMLQSAEILTAFYPNDFTLNDIERHIDDLLVRFRNTALKDTIFRVGQDLPRKLGIDDRFMGIILMAKEMGLRYNNILDAMSYGFFFNKEDEYGEKNLQDKLFLQCLKEKGIGITLTKFCGFDAERNSNIINEIEYYYLKLKKKMNE
ncbi:MAG TPA: mannitol-1-phosphate 5-dehydrogenase, partial [Clostridiales bacterium]|nr:mannitol-1-phosphate 5-dehydrogenase [Clostridiales bacterium]